MTILAIVVACLALGLAVAPFFPTRSPATVWLLLPKYRGTAWAPHVALLGALGGALGVLFGSVGAIVVGIVAALVAADYVYRVNG